MSKKRNEIEYHEADHPQQHKRVVAAVGLYSRNIIISADGRISPIRGHRRPSSVVAARGYSRDYR